MYNRGLLYQTENPTSWLSTTSRPNGQTPQRTEALLARVISYLDLDKIKETAADLDEAAQADPSERTNMDNPGGSPLNASATRPGPPAHMPALSTSVPRMSRAGFRRIL